MTERQPPPEELDDRLALYRRGVFDRHLVERADEARRGNTPLALVMMDLDHFKAVNDNHGHQVGDEVLSSIATLVKDRVAGKGAGYRYGGEEIAMLLPNYSAEEATAFAEVLRRTIEGYTVSSKAPKVTASFGIACLPDHATAPKQLLEEADKAMYEAKQLGRNYVRVAGEPRPAVTAPRTTSRREPEPGGLTEDEKEQIRIAYFRMGSVQCPKDLAWLNVRVRHQAGHDTPDLFIHCPQCGLSYNLSGPS